MELSTLFEQAPAPPWFRWAMVALGGVGLVASVLFVGGYLFAPAVRYRRTSLLSVDQWLLYAAGGAASALYLARWLLDPPPTWGGLGFGLVSILLLGLVDVAFILRLMIWRRARRATR